MHRHLYNLSLSTFSPTVENAFVRQDYPQWRQIETFVSQTENLRVGHSIQSPDYLAHP